MLHLFPFPQGWKRGMPLSPDQLCWLGTLVLNRCPREHSQSWNKQTREIRRLTRTCAYAGSSHLPTQQAPAGSLGPPIDRPDPPQHPPLSTNSIPHSPVSPASGASLLPTGPNMAQGSAGPATGCPGQRPGSAGQASGTTGRKHLVARRKLDSGVSADREQEVRELCCRSILHASRASRPLE